MTSPVDTWWGLLLSGLLGSLVGGGATVIAVWLTIRHERRMREEDRIHEAVATSHADAGAVLTTVATGHFMKPAGFPVFGSFLESIAGLASRAQRREPQLAWLIRRTGEALTDATNRVTGSSESIEGVRLKVVTMHVLLSRWLADPDEIRSGRLTFDKLGELVADATAFNRGPTEQASTPSGWRSRIRSWTR